MGILSQKLPLLAVAHILSHLLYHTFNGNWKEAPAWEEGVKAG